MTEITLGEHEEFGRRMATIESELLNLNNWLIHSYTQHTRIGSLVSKISAAQRSVSMLRLEAGDVLDLIFRGRANVASHKDHRDEYMYYRAVHDRSKVRFYAEAEAVRYGRREDPQSVITESEWRQIVDYLNVARSLIATCANRFRSSGIRAGLTGVLSQAENGMTGIDKSLSVIEEILAGVSAPATKRPAFVRWLLSHCGEPTPLGDLAHEVSLDRGRPQRGSRAVWLKYMSSIGASATVIDSVNDAWDLYEMEPIMGDARPVVRRSDDHYSIFRPQVPGYGAVRGLTRVLVDPVPSYPDIEGMEYEQASALIDAYLDRSRYAGEVSGRVYREAVEQIGKFFRREFGFDFAPYSSRIDSHTTRDDEYHAYLFFDDGADLSYDVRVNGACGFMWDEKSGRWYLMWVWLHPYKRRKGILASHWPAFKQMYGNDFGLDYPLSDAMQGFLKKMGHPLKADQ